MTIRWHASHETCPHSNDDVCPTCDFDGYYAANYPGCPWRDDWVDEYDQPAAHGATRGHDNATGPRTVIESLTKRCEHGRLLADWCIACEKAS